MRLAEPTCAAVPCSLCAPNQVMVPIWFLSIASFTIFFATDAQAHALRKQSANEMMVASVALMCVLVFLCAGIRASTWHMRTGLRRAHVACTCVRCSGMS